MTAIISRYEL